MRILTYQEIIDLINGCAILGTGGGGDPRKGLALLQEILQEGGECKLIKLDEISDNALVASPYMCGSVSAEEKLATAGPKECLAAFLALEEFLGRRFSAVVATEIGGGNTAIAFYVAAKRGLPLVDADPAGRSVPELQHSTFYVNHVPIGPIAVASSQGEVVIIKTVTNDLRAEAVVRAIAVACGNRVGVADHPITGALLKQTVIPGTVSKALALGKAIREAKESGGDPVAAAVREGKGYKLFQGTVARHDWRITEGFTIGELLIAGDEEFKGHQYRIWYKNEHLVAWFDDKPDVITPDLICVLDPTSGEAIINPACKVGMRVAVIGFPAPSVWRTPRGLEVLGPKHFGFAMEYKKIEENRRLPCFNGS